MPELILLYGGIFDGHGPLFKAAVLRATKASPQPALRSVMIPAWTRGNLDFASRGLNILLARVCVSLIM